MEPRIGTVFVAGGAPTVTYVPRDSLELEGKLRDYLDERYRILSLAGPTKSGKTVLVRRVAPEAVWISGGNVSTVASFWEALADSLGAYAEETRERSEEQNAEKSVSAEGGVDFVVKAKGGVTRGTGESSTKRQAYTRKRPADQLALDGLKRDRDTIIFVDDFHYIGGDVQLGIVRGLKAPVFEGTRVILASVPHRAYDSVRVEKEMTGRVEPLVIPFWDDDELKAIARQGFDALNLEAPTADAARLAHESFGSPLLMQEFCLEYCKANGIRERPEIPTKVRAPEWMPFFTEQATAASKMAFDLLATGPRQRSDRIQRRFKDGRTGDIYEAVLAAIAATGPRTSLPYDELRASLRNVLDEEPPQRHEVTRVLDELTKIAREKIEGEPVVEFDEMYDMVYISDPYFAYFLRWGVARLG